MRVLLLRANPRSTGCSQRLGDWFLEGLRDAGAQVVEADLPRLRIERCDGCFHCWFASPGQCVHQDDQGPLLEELLAANVLACVTPLYYFSMASALKTFFERTFPLVKPGLVPSSRGFTRNRLRCPEQWQGKKLITIVAGALRHPALYEPINQTFQLIADSLDLEVGGQLTRPESYLLDYPLSKPRTLKLITQAFVQAGREAGTTGRISPQTIRTAATPLAADEEHFQTYSNVFWDEALRLGPQALSPAAISARVSQDVRILMREMVRCHDPKATARVKAVLFFDFFDVNLVYSIALNRGHCVLAETKHDHPDLTIRCTAATWGALFTRQLDVPSALKHRQILIEGDKSLFARLERFFPAPRLESRFAPEPDP